ncbi:MAG TPA: hypothetical protein DCP28_22195, partial [Cytophagales bacterium]|nr:hypothetical protein [Cytophagales bacterium]
MKLVLATRADAERVNTLRVDAYKTATGSVLRDFDFLLWNSVDDRACVLCLENSEGKFVASLRCIWVNELAELEDLCDAKIASPPPFPTLYQDKLTTLVDYRLQRLSMIFRIFVMQAAIESDIQSFSFTINETASRVPLLQNLGYQFTPADLSHRQEDNAFNNSVGVLIGSLHHKHFPTALEEAIKSQVYPLEEVQLGASLATDTHELIRKAWA